MLAPRYGYTLKPDQVEGDTSRHLLGVLELEIRPGSSRTPGRRGDCPPALTRGEDRRLFITPECNSFEGVEGQLNSLQDELDEIRERARRAFHVT